MKAQAVAEVQHTFDNDGAVAGLRPHRRVMMPASASYVLLSAMP